MRRPALVRLTRATSAVSAATALAVALAGCATDVTRPRVENSLGPVFANLYTHQQALLGHPGLTPAAVAAKASCDKGGPQVPDRGAGSDWICQLRWTDSAGKPQNGKFELQVRSNGCYQAGGPSKLVGPLTIKATTGTYVINPVFEFDGCFDTT
ncbi:hypothetical protein [Frankia sp. CeD]|uniref:hypothetical protein n=1 Tax=Frankia sp. CeD TaxID=258230 RepID=UPI0004DD4E9E|nr:hypothetical protein [Frankia sp. CeD]KEZ34653.1 hypothetical protein CEDDRAFT_03996 [Frankia sp. CeD]